VAEKEEGDKRLGERKRAWGVGGWIGKFRVCMYVCMYGGREGGREGEKCGWTEA